MPYLKAAQVVTQFPDASNWEHGPSTAKASNFSKAEIQTFYVQFPSFQMLAS